MTVLTATNSLVADKQGYPLLRLSGGGIPRIVFSFDCVSAGESGLREKEILELPKTYLFGFTGDANSWLTEGATWQSHLSLQFHAIDFHTAKDIS